MTVLEIIAEQRLGTKNLVGHPGLRAALKRIERAVRRGEADDDEKARIASVVDLCFAYERETDVDEKANILRTIAEVSENETLELPSETIEQWEKSWIPKIQPLQQRKRHSIGVDENFEKSNFSLRAKAGLRTQDAVAKRAGLRRSYVAVIEAGVHFPQQKTVQKLAKAFDVDVAELLA